MMIVLGMIGGDVLARSATTDNVRASALPNAWRIGQIRLAGIVLGIGAAVFCGGLG
ncbi:MAG: hypothetical protein ACYCV6_12615 [Steroidobacteraceae bacterium]